MCKEDAGRMNTRTSTKTAPPEPKSPKSPKEQQSRTDKKKSKSNPFIKQSATDSDGDFEDFKEATLSETPRRRGLVRDFE